MRSDYPLLFLRVARGQEAIPTCQLFVAGLLDFLHRRDVGSVRVHVHLLFYRRELTYASLCLLTSTASACLLSNLQTFHYFGSLFIFRTPQSKRKQLMKVENPNIVWRTTSGEEYAMGRIIIAHDEFQFLPDENTKPAFNARDLRNIAVELENLEQRNS
jgi:hypothetical protein